MSIYDHYNGKFGLICLAVYLIMFYRGHSTFTGKISQSKNYWFVFICIALYSVLGFLEYDTYSYYTLYEDMYASGMKVHVEWFYFWLITALPHSYFLWRLVIWTATSVFLLLSAKQLGLNPTVFAFFVPLLLLRNLSMTRESLGICLMLFSGILLIKAIDKKKTFLFLFAIAGIISSSFLHKTMFVFITFFVLSLFIPLTKRTFVISLILFPILYSLSLRLFNNFVPVDLLRTEQLGVITSYQDSVKSDQNINGIVFSIVEKGTLLLFIFLMVKKFLFDGINTSKPLFAIFKYAYVMTYISFLFFGQEISNWISYRTLHVAYFALALCAIHCFDTTATGQHRFKIEKITFIMLLIISLYNTVPFIISYW